MALTDSNLPGDSVMHVYGRYLVELRRFFKRRALHRDRAEDFVQLVYLRLLNCPTLAEVREPEKFIYKVAWHVLYTENRRSAYERQLTVSIDSDEFEKAITTNSRLWVDDSTTDVDRAHFEQALGSLTRAQQIVFRLRYVTGHPYKQISDETGIPLDTVKKYLSKALAHLRNDYDAGAPE